jgi:hypothetical protein
MDFRVPMRISALMLLAVAGVAWAQERPDFSGEWAISGAPSGVLGERFVAKQDAKMLVLDLTVAALGRPVRATYALDGSESKNMNPSPSSDVADEPIFSRVSWEGARLVILTRGTRLVNGKPIESKRVLTLGNDGTLTIERTSDGQPPSRSVYKRVR